MTRERILLAAAPSLLSVAVLSGCFGVQETAAPPPPPVPASTTVVVQPPGGPAQRAITYAEGRYELRGDGKTVPYYWVWIPSGTTYALAPPAPPATTVVVPGPPVQRTIQYPEGRYELYGDGARVPYYWVWIPAGSRPPYPPPPAS